MYKTHIYIYIQLCMCVPWSSYLSRLPNVGEMVINRLIVIYIPMTVVMSVRPSINFLQESNEEAMLRLMAKGKGGGKGGKGGKGSGERKGWRWYLDLSVGHFYLKMPTLTGTCLGEMRYPQNRNVNGKYDWLWSADSPCFSLGVPYVQTQRWS